MVRINMLSPCKRLCTPVVLFRTAVGLLGLLCLSASFGVKLLRANIGVSSGPKEAEPSVRAPLHRLRLRREMV